MRLFFTTILLWLLFMSQSSAQNALADLHFEEAEKAYNQQSYNIALGKLDQVEQAVGTTSKTLYLRIVVQDKMMLQPSNKDSKLELCENLLSNTANYLDIMSAYGIDDKFRDVYAIQEKYKNYDGSALSLVSADYVVEPTYQLPAVFLPSYDFSDESRFYQLYPNGHLVVKGERKDGKPTGLWEWRDETDGQIWRSVIYNADGSIYMSEYTKGYYQAKLVGVLNPALAQLSTIEVRSVFGRKKKQSTGLGNLQEKLKEQIENQQTGEGRNMLWSVYFSADQRMGNESCTEAGKLKAMKSWHEKNGQRIQEIDIYHENGQIDHKVLYINGSPIMRVPYENGGMLSAAKIEYDQILRDL